MATQITRDFHAQQKREEDARVAIRIQSGTKASNNLEMGRRMMNRTFKGYVPNASGVGQRPFFINKDEAKTPLEDKVAMRGGVLSTPAGQTYAKKILARRAMDIRNQENLEAGIPPEPSPLVEMTEVESRTIELNQLMSTLGTYVTEGLDATQILPDYRNLVRLIVSLSATFSQSDLAFIDDWASNIASQLENRASQNREENALGRPVVAQRENKSLQVLAELTGKISLFIERIAEFVNSDDKTKRTAIRAAANDIFGRVGRLESSRVEAIAEEAAGPATRREDSAPPPPPPTSPAPRRGTAPPPPLPREEAKEADEEAPAPARTQARTPARGVDLTTYEASAGASLTSQDESFLNRIRDLMSSGAEYKLQQLNAIARARGINPAGKSKAVVKGLVLRDAGFSPQFRKL